MNSKIWPACMLKLQHGGERHTAGTRKRNSVATCPRVVEIMKDATACRPDSNSTIKSATVQLKT